MEKYYSNIIIRWSCHWHMHLKTWLFFKILFLYCMGSKFIFTENGYLKTICFISILHRDNLWSSISFMRPHPSIWLTSNCIKTINIGKINNNQRNSLPHTLIKKKQYRMCQSIDSNIGTKCNILYHELDPAGRTAFYQSSYFNYDDNSMLGVTGV